MPGNETIVQPVGKRIKFLARIIRYPDFYLLAPQFPDFQFAIL